jgi:hypothetical protein
VYEKVCLFLWLPMVFEEENQQHGVYGDGVMYISERERERGSRETETASRWSPACQTDHHSHTLHLR